MRRSPDVSPRRLSDISPQLRQLKYLVVDEAIKEDLKWSRSVEDLTGGPAGLTCIEERILRITGYYGYQPWAASCTRKTRPPAPALPLPPRPGARGGFAAPRTRPGDARSPGPLGLPAPPASPSPPLPARLSARVRRPRRCHGGCGGRRERGPHWEAAPRIRKCRSRGRGCAPVRDADG